MALLEKNPSVTSCFEKVRGTSMFLFSRERKKYFQQDCKERNDEIIEQKY